MAKAYEPIQATTKKTGKRFLVTKSPGHTLTTAKKSQLIDKLERLKSQKIKDASPIKCKPLPDWELLNSRFKIVNGRLVYRSSFLGAPKGTIAGCNSLGYGQIYVGNIPYREHRLVFKMHHRRDPVGMLDHIDGDKLNNHPSNLREVTARQNNQNRHKSKSNTGVVGVSFYANRYHADIGWNGSIIHLGSYLNLQDAIAARKLGEHHLFDRPAMPVSSAAEAKQHANA